METCKKQINDENTPVLKENTPATMKRTCIGVKTCQGIKNT